MKRILLKIVVVLGVLILIAAIGLFWIGYSLNKSIEPKTDPALYADIVAERAKLSNRYAFLPKSIPKDAKNIFFFHIPKFMQGADVIALRFSLPEASISQTIKELQTSGREEIKSFEDIPPPLAYPQRNMTKRSSNDIFEGVSELPTDFRIFLVDCNLADIEKNWNHHILSFTAVSESRNEVVYYIDNG
jgi:hypothetical protein